MFCPRCGSNQVKEHISAEGEVEEVPGVLLQEAYTLCSNCGWGYRLAGTLDKRSKQEQKKNPIGV